MSMATDSCSCQQLIRVSPLDIVQPMVATRADSEFHDRLEQACDAAGIPEGRGRRAALARLFGVSGEAARKWLSGESIPDTKRIPKIAKHLGVSGEWLLTGQGPMRPELSEALAAGQAGITGTVRPDAVQLLQPPDLKTLMESLSEELERAPPEVREAVGRLLLTYAREPAQGAKIAAAIQALLGKDADPAA